MWSLSLVVAASALQTSRGCPTLGPTCGYHWPGREPKSVNASMVGMLMTSVTDTPPKCDRTRGQLATRCRGCTNCSLNRMFNCQPETTANPATCWIAARPGTPNSPSSTRHTYQFTAMQMHSGTAVQPHESSVQDAANECRP